MLGTLMAAWSLIILPIVFRISFSLGNDNLPSGAVTFKTIGLSMRLDWKTIHTPKGISVSFCYGSRKQTHEHNIQKLRKMKPQMKMLLSEAPFLRQNLFSYLKNFRIKSDISIGLSDAAATALTCGAVSALCGCFRQISAHIKPDFNSESICINAKCIVVCSLGKLLLSAALYLHVNIMQKMRQKIRR